MADLETLYLKLPPLLQHVICSLEGGFIQRTRFGDPFSALLHEAERRTFWPVERVRAYRDQRLRVFIQTLCPHRAFLPTQVSGMRYLP